MLECEKHIRLVMLLIQHFVPIVRQATSLALLAVRICYAGDVRICYPDS
jgi:hypothetical protein